MSSCKMMFFFVAALVVFIDVEIQAKDLCQRPNTFETVKHVHEYLECIKSQATTRYGKRASSSVIGKLRPDLYNNENFLQLYDILYADN